MRTKAEHVRYLDSAPPEVEILFSGPLAGENGDESGSAIIFAAPHAAAVRSFLSHEPYHCAGLYAETELRQWLWRRGNPFL
jgi:uncharacterized protein YciI